ncbi:hypothetical protein H0I29_01130 [Polaribacter sp. R2A056_3_33]|uniref:hypothetical protein n=1 Tax=Polaribacter sp. R2A056_3_33 TaxID=2745563 RepID=UPI001C4E6555|nr:hypothetical protein [Polaribacter sp. R2A056_3_33]QXP70730.1 hypothetical protein H0I29_01130 [Polaribacter sp. R2A056_3_33]
MESKYFGIIPKELNSLNKIIQLENFLKENDLIIISNKLEIIKSTKTENLGERKNVVKYDHNNTGYKFTDELTIEVYDFLLNQYKNSLCKNILFNINFDDETFGFLEARKKEAALIQFKNLYSKWTNNLPTMVSENEFNKLKRARALFQNQLKYQYELVVAFLIGEINYFNRDLLQTNELLIEMFDFENDLLILIDLNQRFSFTEDNVFTKKTIAQIIYKEYPEEFHSLKQIEFIEHLITIKDIINRAFIVSLFDFFSNKLNIKTPSAESFGKIINSHFGFTFGEIKLNSSEGDKHFKRVKEIEKEWGQF